MASPIGPKPFSGAIPASQGTSSGAHPSTDASIPESVKEKFEFQILSKSTHLEEHQINHLWKLLSDAMKAENPRMAFSQKVKDCAEKNFHWTKNKLTHLESFETGIPEKNAFATTLDNMSAHIRPKQKALLEDLYGKSMKSDNPQKSFENFVDSNVGWQVDAKFEGWGPEKAKIIKDNLAIFLPLTQASSTQNIDEISKMAKTKLVSFYKNGPTACFGNFAHCSTPIECEGFKFKNAEAAFQFLKIIASQRRLGIRDDVTLAKFPALAGFFNCTGQQAFDLSLQFKDKGLIDTNWWIKPGIDPAGRPTLSGRDSVMLAVLQEKFTKNPDHRASLEATKGSYLLEHNTRPGKDDYWSDNHDGTGYNRLGQMLMAIREGTPLGPPIKDAGQEFNTAAKGQAATYGIH